MNNLIRSIVDFLLRVFGSKPSEHSCPYLTISSATRTRFEGEIGKTITEAIGVFVSDVHGNPAVGEEVKLTVFSGTVIFGDGSKSKTLRTGKDGKVMVDLRFASKGHGMVAAELLRDTNKGVYFGGHSNGMSHDLFMYANPCVPADTGKITARIQVFDFLRNPVPDAKLVFSGMDPFDQGVDGEVRNLGNGTYEGSIKTNTAGQWVITAQDEITKAFIHKCVNVLPGVPNRFTFPGSRDPRATEPYGEITFEVRLEDKYGNALDPGRITGNATNASLQCLPPFDLNARFKVSTIGYSNVEFFLKDEISGINERITLPFAAVWLENPGYVEEGTNFRTCVYALPPTDREVTHATIEIEFNPELSSFVELHSHPEAPPIVTETRVNGNLLIISIKTEDGRKISAKDYPNGIPIGYCEWSCLGEGQTCFALVGKMSPSTPKWELCLDQKKKVSKCICINIIYKAGDATRKNNGITAANQVLSVIGATANVNQCCPVITTNVKSTSLDATQWQNILNAIGADGEVNSNDDYSRLVAEAAGKRDRCINIHILPIKHPTSRGRMYSDNRGGAIDTDIAGSRANVGAHETGHALGVCPSNSFSQA